MPGFFSKLKRKFKPTAADRFQQNYAALDNDEDRLDAIIEGTSYANVHVDDMSKEDSAELSNAVRETTEGMSDVTFNALISRKLDAQQAVIDVYHSTLDRLRKQGMDEEQADYRARVIAQQSEAGEREAMLFGLLMNTRQYTDPDPKKHAAVARRLENPELEKINGFNPKDAVKKGYVSKDELESMRATSESRIDARQKRAKIGGVKESADRKKEVHFNDFGYDTSMPEEIKSKIRFGTTTHDIAIAKMLQNVTPEMLKADPQLASDLNKLVGGAMASQEASFMSGKETKIDKMGYFRSDSLAQSNVRTLTDKYAGNTMSDMIAEQTLGRGYTPDSPDMQVGLANGLYAAQDYMYNTEEGQNVTQLMGHVAQGMNGQGFSDSDRSRMMMNNVTLRNIAPALFTSGDRDKMKISHATQNAVNKPDDFYDPTFMQQYGDSLMYATGEDSSAQLSRRGMAATKSNPTAQQPKKKWWQFWK